MGIRKIPLVNGEIYHIYTKSIAKFKIFKKKSEYKRMEESFNYYRSGNSPLRFSIFLQIKDKKGFLEKQLSKNCLLVEIIAYCIMPTHVHLIIKQCKDDGISIFMQNILNSYSHYFNLKNKRKGPLWQTRFENKLVKNEEQLLHLSRYIHLNPVTAKLIDRPEDWQYSSYRHYLDITDNSQNWLSSLFNYVSMNPKIYKNFVNDNISYQQELQQIKNSFNSCYEPGA